MDPCRIAAICAELERRYGNPRLGNKDDPLDEIIYIILSTRTQDARFQVLYQQLKERFPVWNEVDESQRSAVYSLISPGGLGTLKTQQILAILDILRREFGSATLEPLAAMDTDRAESFLTSLPGVSAKVAKCVLMYSLARPVLPVDIHVHRVATRLGFKTKKRPDTSQDLIEGAVPPHLRYGFHVNAIAHGRAICVARKPKCESCGISQWCDYAHRTGRIGNSWS